MAVQPGQFLRHLVRAFEALRARSYGQGGQASIAIVHSQRLRQFSVQLKTLAGEGGEGRVVAPIQGQKPASLARGSAGNATAFDDGRSHATQREIIRHCSTNHSGTTNYYVRSFWMCHMPL